MSHQIENVYYPQLSYLLQLNLPEGTDRNALIPGRITINKTLTANQNNFGLQSMITLV